MPFFSDTVAAALRGEVVRPATLVHLDYRTAPKRVHGGFGVIRAGGYEWSGLGELGSISDLESAMGGTAPMATFSLSGVAPDLIADALAASSEVKGRDVTVFLQFFDASLAPLDGPYAIYRGTMDRMRVHQDRGSSTRTIEVTAETLFARRAIPPFAFLSDRDQNRLFPGDRGLVGMPMMVSRTVTWPLT